MKTLRLGEKYDRPIVIALGFFDCIHLGHKLLADTARESAESKGFESALFTFSNDLSTLPNYEKQIYDFNERAEAVKNLGIDVILYAAFDKNFAEMSPEVFLSTLTDNLNIREIIVGEDYTFGKNAAGNIDMLRDHCEKCGIVLNVKQFLCENGSKISTRELKKYVKNGDVKYLNTLLSEPYFLLGKVEHARNVGTKLGFPTANITINENRLPIADGIYATRIYVDGSFFDSMTNVGGKPTFGVSRPSIEAYIFDFDGDLYGKDVKLAFYQKTRDVTRFSSAEGLINQLKHDEIQIREILRSLE